MNMVLIITGGSRGIGAATAKLAAQRGWNVMTTYIERREPAETVVNEIRAMGGNAATMQVNTSREEDVQQLFDATEKQFGPVTGLVNNAGMNGGPATLVNIPVDEIRRLIDINIFGCILCAREAVKRMSTSRGGEGGAIVNI